MNSINEMFERARLSPKHIVLAEGADQRVIDAAINAVNEEIAQITLLGNEKEIRALLKKSGENTHRISIIDPVLSYEMLLEDFYNLKVSKNVDLEAAKSEIKKSLNFANLMVYKGLADGSVAGAVHTSKEVILSALKIIGTKEPDGLISSSFIMQMLHNSGVLKGSFIFSDGGVVIDPNAEELAQITIASSETAKSLLNLEPKIALLSFSTHKSANHPHVGKIFETLKLVKAINPKLDIDGPLQFDAAIIPSVANKKAPNSSVAGDANIFIFPDLNSGNIAYKITERLGGAKAIGPILQGLNKPANDLSRGSDVEAITNMVMVTVLQAQARGSHN